MYTDYFLGVGFRLGPSAGWNYIVAQVHYARPLKGILFDKSYPPKLFV